MGRPLPVEDAKAAGLVNTIVEAAAVDDTALQAAREIAALPPGAVALARRLMQDDVDAVAARIDTEANHFQERLKSEEARAAFAAFFTRKKMS
jgi:enoyl-CoA hydratase/carnithine racemase